MRYSVKRRLVVEEGGFTLTEVLVTMVMMITVMFALYSIFDMGLRVFSFGNDKTEAVENARLGMERMEREIRAAYPYDKVADPSEDHLFWSSGDPGTPDVPPDNQITFGNDLNGNREIASDIATEEITYSLSGDSPPAVLRNGEPMSEFTRANGLTFVYCKSANDCPPSASITEEEINIVRIKLEVEVDRGVNGPTTQTLTTDVALRNRND